MSSASDLLLHLRPCAINVSFEGRWYTIPALDAVDWVVHIEGDHADLYEIFPVLAGQEAIEHVEEALWEQRVSSQEVGDVAFQALSLAADRPWWLALRILASARDGWHIVHVNRAVGMSLAGWLDEIWTNIINHTDPKKLAAWIGQMETPPKGLSAEVDVDAEEQAFLNAMKAVMQ